MKCLVWSIAVVNVLLATFLIAGCQTCASSLEDISGKVSTAACDPNTQKDEEIINRLVFVLMDHSDTMKGQIENIRKVVKTAVIERAGIGDMLYAYSINSEGFNTEEKGYVFSSPDDLPEQFLTVPKSLVSGKIGQDDLKKNCPREQQLREALLVARKRFLAAYCAWRSRLTGSVDTYQNRYRTKNSPYLSSLEYIGRRLSEYKTVFSIREKWLIVVGDLNEDDESSSYSHDQKIMAIQASASNLSAKKPFAGVNVQILRPTNEITSALEPVWKKYFVDLGVDSDAIGFNYFEGTGGLTAAPLMLRISPEDEKVCSTPKR